VHRFAALISSALTFVVIRDYIDVSPAAKAVAPAATKSTKKIPTASEVAELLTAAETFGKDMAKAITIAALTGASRRLRVGYRWVPRTSRTRIAPVTEGGFGPGASPPYPEEWLHGEGYLLALGPGCERPDDSVSFPRLSVTRRRSTRPDVIDRVASVTEVRTVRCSRRTWAHSPKTNGWGPSDPSAECKQRTEPS
jgi:hypothetical protein